MKKVIKSFENKKAITLISLVVTIIVLVILAAVAINMTIGNNGLFIKAKLAKQEYINSADKERKDVEVLANDVDAISGATGSARSESTKIKSLINKDDGLYNKTDGGYIFDTPTTKKIWTTNNTITLTETLENYDYLIFDTQVFRSSSSAYTYFNSIFESVDSIKENYIAISDPSKSCFLINDSGDVFARLTLCFNNNKTLSIYESWTNNSNFTKIRIKDIKGIKY